jgi:hypothetical protein
LSTYTTPRDAAWFRDRGSVSDRQWRDVVAILRTRAGALDTQYLETTAEAVGLDALLSEAVEDAECS